ncbi:GTP cyclohydrolase II RibA [Paucibacter oligotrophus]
MVVGRMHSFDGLSDEGEHFALELAPRTLSGAVPLVRVHSECVTGDVLGSLRCDCGAQMREALQRIHDDGGFILYLRQEGRGIGLYRKLDAYRLQEQGLDTFSANRALGRGDDERRFNVAAEMLSALGVPRIRLLSNNPAKKLQLIDCGIAVDTMELTGVHVSRHNRSYLEAKVLHTQHQIALDSELPEKQVP